MAYKGNVDQWLPSSPPPHTREVSHKLRFMKNENNLALGMAIGIAIGAAIGVATDNLAIWIGVGVAVGAGFGSALKKKNNKDKSSEKNN